MAQTITNIKIPMCAYSKRGFAVVGTFTVGIYTGKSPDVPVLVDTQTINASALAFITQATYNSLPYLLKWSDLGIVQAQWADFELDTPIEIEDDDYIISLSMADGDEETLFFIAGRSAIINPYERYDFNAVDWISDNQTPHQYFGFYLYDESILIGSRQIDEVLIGYTDIEGDVLSDNGNWYQHIGYHVGIGDGLDPSQVAPTIATNPDPADDAVDILTSQTAFSWEIETNEEYIDHYEVYFDDGTGTLPDEPTTIAYTKDFIIGHSLQPLLTYKWRVDSVNSVGITTGTVWEFTVTSASYYSPGLKQPFVWASQSDDYENFETGNKDAEAFELAITSTNEVRWIESIESILIGTAGDEWRIYSNKMDTPITPTNFTIKKQGRIGSAYIQPCISNEVILFVDRVKRKVYEMVWSGDNDKYVSNDMCSLAEHITKTGIVCMAFQKNPEPVLWCVLANGSLISFSYDRAQQVTAWSRHPIDGLVQSVCVTPGATEDEVWLSVQRTIGAEESEEEVIYIEKMAPRELDDIDDSFFVDCGITTSVSASVTIDGLDHLEGKTVQVLADGVNLGTFTVTDGEITLAESTTATKVQIGLPFEYNLKPMRIVFEGPGGSSMGSITKVDELVLCFLNSLDVKYGTSASNLLDVPFTDTRWENDKLIDDLFTGDVRLAMPGGFSVQNPILISGDGPYPCCLKAIVAKVAVTGK